MASLSQIATALADALAPLRGVLDDIQILPELVLNPTPPCIDIYPGDPFREGVSFDTDDGQLLWTVRARVATGDHSAGQAELLKMMDRTGTASVVEAFVDDQTLGGVVDTLSVDGPTGFRLYIDSGDQGALLGCEWTVTVLESGS